MTFVRGGKAAAEQYFEAGKLKVRFQIEAGKSFIRETFSKRGNGTSAFQNVQALGYFEAVGLSVRPSEQIEAKRSRAATFPGAPSDGPNASE